MTFSSTVYAVFSLFQNLPYVQLSSLCTVYFKDYLSKSEIPKNVHLWLDIFFPKTFFFIPKSVYCVSLCIMFFKDYLLYCVLFIPQNFYCTVYSVYALFQGLYSVLCTLCIFYYKVSNVSCTLWAFYSKCTLYNSYLNLVSML